MDPSGDRECPARQRHRRRRATSRAGGLHPRARELNPLIRWWPLGGLAGLIVLGLAVGKGSTPVDDWFQTLGDEHRALRYLLVFTEGRVILTLCGLVFLAALIQRRWQLAVATLVTPFLAVMAARLAKRLFGRFKGAELAYPSGHTTLALVVLAMAVLLFGAATWAVRLAVVVVTLGAFGQGVTYHYFTDTIGALFLGSAFVCAAVQLGRLDTCQPRRDGDHTAG